MKDLESLFWNAVTLSEHMVAEVAETKRQLKHSRKHKSELMVKLYSLSQKTKWAHELCEYLDEARRNQA